MEDESKNNNYEGQVEYGYVFEVQKNSTLVFLPCFLLILIICVKSLTETEI